MGILDRALNLGEAKQFKSYEKRVTLVAAFEPELELESDDELRERFDELRRRVREENLALVDAVPESFALTREAAKRVMGMRHFDVQLIGGMVLNGGNIAEMKTGEGKTLTGTLAVVLNALSGKGVHVVTVNDYLARRDAEWMTPIYEFLGLKVGILQNMQAYEAPTPNSASTTCATTWPRTSPRRSSTAGGTPRRVARWRPTTSRWSTRSTTSSSTRPGRR